MLASLYRSVALRPLLGARQRTRERELQVRWRLAGNSSAYVDRTYVNRAVGVYSSKLLIKAIASAGVRDRKTLVNG